MQRVGQENWTHTGYKSIDLQALITIGAKPGEDTSAEPIIQYFVTLLDLDLNEVFQQGFNELEEALEFINERYGHWDFADREKSSKTSGCDSCAAH